MINYLIINNKKENSLIGKIIVSKIIVVGSSPIFPENLIII